MKRIFAITFLNHLVSGGLALIIPLLLLKRNVNLAEIGIVISILPLVFLVVRLLLATLADQVGWARFYLLLNWPGTVFSTLIYLVANSIPAFLLGKIVEAVKVSSYWAVNRTAIFSLSPKQKAAGATRNAAVISLSTAIGSAISGVALVFMGFELTLGMLILASAIMVIPAALLWRAQRMKSRAGVLEAMALLNPRDKGKIFWFVSFAMLFFSLAFYPLFALLLPVFMVQQLGYDYITIGVAFMLYGLLAASVTFSTLRIRLDIRRVVVQSVIALFVTFLLANSGSYFLALFLALALADGLGIGFFESIIAKATKNELTVSVDVGLLHIPMRVAEFTSVLLAGFVAQSFGYMPVFAASGIFFTVFSVLSLYALKM
ncbi:MAG: MFS transporter [Candidatus Bathyarchaeota archaeon]|nr:MFS transporter [Candidatus Bathyarchaeota archaeon]MDH5495677.1 MFS transporter [Candidatus Bathyarchaeota archaeon]